MASYKILLLLFLPFLFSPTIVAQVTYLHHNCSSIKTFTANSTFQLHRSTLLSSLASINTTTNSDFYNTTVISDGGGDTIYDLFMCYGDHVNISSCHQCVVNAAQRLSSECMSSKEAIIWYDVCMIRYSNHSFFSTVDTSPRFGQSDTGSVSNQASFMRTLYDTMNKTSNEANFSATASQGKAGISSGRIVAILLVPISVAALIFISCSSKRIRKKYDSVAKGISASDINNVDSLKYVFSTIEAATSKFSINNKPGESKFGEVYKGVLSNGQGIAVKKLTRRYGKGVQEFKNEAEVVTKLQHRNLVRLLGFCIHKEKKILIYEYAPNKSLGQILFDPERKGQLNWTNRYKIVKGIAQCLQYLHDDSRLRIIHRNLNAYNVLLDNDINPKISDFSMAKLFTIDQTQGNGDIAGTLGYIAPEYTMYGDFSVKTDAYSFGVLLMEIVSGKKNSSFHQMEGAEDLLSYAWKLWRDGEPLELLEPTIREFYNPNEVVRCIHIGLLCVQDDPRDRPTMASVVIMLDTYSLTLPTPSRPAYSLVSAQTFRHE